MQMNSKRKTVTHTVTPSSQTFKLHLDKSSKTSPYNRLPSIIQRAPYRYVRAYIKNTVHRNRTKEFLSYNKIYVTERLVKTEALLYLCKTVIR